MGTLALSLHKTCSKHRIDAPGILCDRLIIHTENNIKSTKAYHVLHVESLGHLQDKPIIGNTTESSFALKHHHIHWNHTLGILEPTVE
jgi:hypothetical protein